MSIHENILPDTYVRMRRLEQAVIGALEMHGCFGHTPGLVARLCGVLLESGLATEEAVNAYGDLYRKAHEANGGAGRPPRGLRPRYVVVPLRITEILEAMQRYSEACKPIPGEWLDELRGLSEWMDCYQGTLASRA